MSQSALLHSIWLFYEFNYNLLVIILNIKTVTITFGPILNICFITIAFEFFCNTVDFYFIFH